MLAHPTLEQLETLGLQGMAKAFAELSARPDCESLTHGEWLALLLEREATFRQDRRLGARLRFAKLRHQAAPEDIKWKTARGLDRTLFTTLLKGDWIDAAENVLLTGPTGVGKSWLACALGVAACRQNRSVFYIRATKLFADFAIAHLDGRYPSLMRKLCSVKVLIIDDWGMTALDAAQRREMMELVEERHGRNALIITSQRPTEAWHEMIGDPTYADAILDRIIHSAHRVKLGAAAFVTTPATMRPEPTVAANPTAPGAHAL